MFHTRVSYQMWVRETFFQCLAIIPWSVIGQIFGQMSSIGSCTTWIRNMSHTHVISKGLFWSLWVPNMWKEKSIKSNFTIFVKLIRSGNSQNWLTLYICEMWTVPIEYVAKFTYYLNIWSSSWWWAGLDPKILPQELCHGFSASWESIICERKLHYPGNRTQNLIRGD